jgi:hypothetical protein
MPYAAAGKNAIVRPPSTTTSAHAAPKITAQIASNVPFRPRRFHQSRFQPSVTDYILLRAANLN